MSSKAEGLDSSNSIPKHSRAPLDDSVGENVAGSVRSYSLMEQMPQL